MQKPLPQKQPQLQLHLRNHWQPLVLQIHEASIIHQITVLPIGVHTKDSKMKNRKMTGDYAGIVAGLDIEKINVLVKKELEGCDSVIRTVNETITSPMGSVMETRMLDQIIMNI